MLPLRLKRVQRAARIGRTSAEGVLARNNNRSRLEGTLRGRGRILSASSWPGLSRPSTSWQIEKKGVDARVKPGHDESVKRSTTQAAPKIHDSSKGRIAPNLRRDLLWLLSSLRPQRKSAPSPCKGEGWGGGQARA